MSQPSSSLEERWRLRASLLRADQWSTDTWDDLEEGLQMRDEGDLASLRDWYGETLGRFQDLCDHCRRHASEKTEPMDEGQLAELFLAEGAEAWLSALMDFRTGTPASQVLTTAERGQRLLVAVQMLEDTVRAKGA